jgi:hypothetical protein
MKLAAPCLATLAVLVVLSPIALAADRAAAPLLDPPPGPRQKPYHPADGQVVEVTPPPLIWVPAGKGRTYSLQVSPAEDFRAEGTRTFTGLRRSALALREPLPAGKWFWRYGIEGPGGTTYGRPRPFTVPPSARPFPFPDLDEVARRIPRDRPRLFFPGDRLAKVREAARGELKEAVGDLVKSCRKHVGEELVPEPGYQPKEPDLRGPWAVNVMRTTRPPMDAMERCALAYLVAGDRELGLEAKRRLLHFFSWDPKGPTSFFAYDEPPMWVMMRGTRAYDWTRDLFDDAERARVEANMKARALQFLERLQSLPFEASPYESHAGRLPGFLGECALSFIHEWPEAREWLEYAILLYSTSYPAWGGDDGGWQEGPGYWSAYMGFALHFVVALKSAAGADLTAKPFFRNTPYYALYTATPYHEHTPFGDGAMGRPGRGQGAVLHAFSSLLRDPALRWYAEATGYRPGTDLLGLATYDPTVAARPPLDLPQARSFPSAGLVSIHTALGKADEDVSFLLRSSPFGSVSHGHADQNAFAVEAFGKGLAIATGYYPWYGSPHHQDWTRATRAVNSILVDGQGQERRSAEARGVITAFIPGEGYDSAEGEAGRAYGERLRRFRRHVVHVRPGTFVIFDDLEAPKPSTFQWLLHAHDRFEIDEGARAFKVRRAPAAMEVRLFLPADVKISQTDRYEPEPEDTKGAWKATWHLTAGTARPDPRGRFLAVLLPHRIGEEAKLPRVDLLEGKGAAGVRLSFPDGSEDLVAFRLEPAPGTSACGGLESDGRVFARGLRKDGTVARRLLHEGKVLDEGGKPVGEPAGGGGRPKAVRSPASPIIRPGMEGLEGEAGSNINGPSIIRAPSWVADPPGRYLLYFAHHQGTSIRLAFADRLEGPWKIHAPGVLRLKETAARGHIASPDVHVDEERRQVRMYFHGPAPSGGGQVTYLATSADGLRFQASRDPLGPFYFRVFRHGGMHYALAKKENRSGVLLRSSDGVTPFEEGPEIIPRMRHAAVAVRGDRLLVFYSRIGDAPESILFSEIPLAGDWTGWRPTEPELVIAPELPYEGASLPLRPSRPGAAPGPVREIRDPCLFAEDGKLYLLYSVAGEGGLGLAELTLISSRLLGASPSGSLGPSS